MGLRDPLPADDISNRLAERDGWEGDTQQIAKTFRVEYHAGLNFINEVAPVMVELEHHPDIDIRWDTVRFIVTTHTAGDVVTELDFLLADRIDEIATRHGAVVAL